MTTIIADESIELRSLGANNNIQISTINSSNAEETAIVEKKSFIKINDVIPSRENTTLLKKKGLTANNNAGKFARMATSKFTIGCLFTFAVIFLVTGITVGILWLGIYHSVLIRQLILSPTSTSYGIWQEIPIPMYLYLHLYNWTNPEEFTTSSSYKPHFVEMGPYVFREQHVKVQKTWNDNETVTYQQRRSWHFEESMSNGSLSDEVTNLNVIATTIARMVKDDGLAARLAVNALLIYFNERLAVTRTAEELLFEGYGDDLLRFANRLNIPGLNIPFERFGWFYGRNESDTYDGVFNMHTGVGDVSNLGQLAKWNYKNQTDHWHGECNSIRGSPGELWPPNLDEESVEVFAPDICTAMSLKRTNDSQFLGVTGHTYVATAETFDNGSLVPSRACYCNEQPCQPSGVLDVAKCKFGAPAFVGLPHFHLADESYVNAIDGMDHLNGDYTFSMTLEPNTGIPLNVHAQLQINILAQPVRNIGIFRNIPRVYFPMLWFKQEVLLTPEYARKIKLLLILPNLGHAIFIVIGCIGLSLGLTAVYLCCFARSKKGDNQVLIEPEENTDAERIDSGAARANPIIS